MNELPDGFVLEEPQTEPPEGFVLEEPEPRNVLQDTVNLASAAVDGASFGLAPKAAAAVGAGIAKPVLEAGELVSDGLDGLGVTNNNFDTPSFGDLYTRGVERNQKLTQDAFKNTPGLAVGATVVGGLAGGLAAGGTRFGQAVSNFANNTRFAGAGRGLAARASRLLEKSARGAVLGDVGLRTFEAGSSAPGEEIDALTKFNPVGSVVGGAVPSLGAVAGGVGKALTPVVDDGLRETAKLARKYNIPLSFDEITDSRAVKNLQKISQGLPFSGQDTFRDIQQKSFNREVAKSFGEDTERLTPEVLNRAFSRLGKEFDDLTAGKSFSAGRGTYKKMIQELRDDAEAYTGDARKVLEKQIGNIEKDIKGGQISGEALGFHRNKLNKLSRKANDLDISSAYKDLENVIIEVATDNDSLKKAAFDETKRKYRNLIAIEPIARSGKAKGGNINPSLLSAQVSKIFGRQFVRGKAGELGDLARIGSDLLPELGGSDTFAKGALGVGALAIEPVVAGAVLGGNRAVQSGVNRNQKLINKAIDAEQKLLAAPKRTGIGSAATSNSIEKVK